MCPLTPVASRTGFGASSALAVEESPARTRTSGTRRADDMTATPAGDTLGQGCTRGHAAGKPLHARPPWRWKGIALCVRLTLISQATRREPSDEPHSFESRPPRGAVGRHFRPRAAEERPRT